MDITSFGVKRTERKLSNGIKLVILNKPQAPIFIRSISSAGSKYDTYGKEGTAHFLEHMLVAGTKNYPTKDKLAMYIEEYGGEFGATTSSEALCINVMIPDFEDVDVGINVLNEILVCPLFDSNTFETERGAIMQELKGKRSKPDQMLWELYPRLFLKGTQLERSILGTEKTIKGITLDDVRDFYSKYITSGNTTIIASGDIDESILVDLLEEKLTLKDGVTHLEENSFKVESHDNEKVLIENNYAGDFIHFFLGFRLEAQDPVENCVGDILCNSLANGRGTLLSRKLRYEKGLVYGLAMFSFAYHDLGTLIFKSSLEKQNFNEAIDIVANEFKSIKENGLNEDLLELTKKKIIKGLKLKLETSQSWVSMYSNWEIGVGAPFGIEEYSKTLTNISNDDIQRFAKKYFNEENWYLAICGNIDKKEIDIKL